ncbi:hypothetical protein GP475_09675 [Corynebacterium poyangense]|uniref:Uncharacterized protein n=1 Tax=Corynebacterium poyangense TaxID=2684405 RepID=A0A7H0SQQ3_9CORY|nr:hypothetical protein [Corynebacterium poyangense]QNQ90878.1 hypothetical protein GP475_09675 [Corynebacterium poyangense]
MAENGVTPDMVAQQLNLDTRDIDYGLRSCVSAVNALINRWVDPDIRNDPATIHGGTMLAARLYRRRNSPAGVESFGELGPVYVSRNDPDLAMTLGLGNYRKIVVA